MDCQPMKFRDVLDNSFYFEVEETNDDVDCDLFMKSQNCKQTKLSAMTKQSDGGCTEKLLVLKTNNEIHAETLTIYESRQPGCTFYIQTYYDSSQPGDPGYTIREGVPVVLYAVKDNLKMVLSCVDMGEIRAVPRQDVEQKIPDSSHMAVFYLKGEGPTRFTLESSIFKDKFLGFGEASSLYKLMLCNNPSPFRQSN